MFESVSSPEDDTCIKLQAQDSRSRADDIHFLFLFMSIINGNSLHSMIILSCFPTYVMSVIFHGKYLNVYELSVLNVIVRDAG